MGDLVTKDIEKCKVLIDIFTLIFPGTDVLQRPLSHPMTVWWPQGTHLLYSCKIPEPRLTPKGFLFWSLGNADSAGFLLAFSFAKKMWRDNNDFYPKSDKDLKILVLFSALWAIRDTMQIPELWTMWRCKNTRKTCSYLRQSLVIRRRHLMSE